MTIALLNDTVRGQLKPMLDGLADDVELALYAPPGDAAIAPEASEVMAALVGEMAELSPRLHATTLAQAPEVEPGRASGFAPEGPILVVRRTGSGEERVRFLGVAGGHEFASLIAAVQNTASGTTELKAASVEALAGLGHRVHIQVFTTPT